MDEGARTSGKGTPVPVEPSDGRRTRRTVGLLVAGPVLWTAHFLVVYLVAEAGCTGGGSGLRLLNPPVPTVATVAATAIAVMACLATAAVAHRQWRALAEAGSDDGGPEPGDRGGSLALAGVVLSLLGVVTVLFVGLPALVLPCAP